MYLTILGYILFFYPNKFKQFNLTIFGLFLSLVLKWVDVCVNWVKVFASGGWLERNLGGLNTSISNQRPLSLPNFNLRLEGRWRQKYFQERVVVGGSSQNKRPVGGSRGAEEARRAILARCESPTA